MCGIAGIWSRTDIDKVTTIAQMISCLRHRGPDSEGEWIGRSNDIALGHTRLSILDLSENGHQPMRSSSGRYTTVFNGEIYNHRQLKEKLDSIQWRGHSDVEVLLESLEKWGVQDTLTRSIGMFAFGLWDDKTRRLTLARDRLGEKPLYYSCTSRGTAFASELKALRIISWLDFTIDEEALGLYLQLGYIPAPRTIYRGIRKLEPGTYLTQDRPDGEPSIKRYWDMPNGSDYPEEMTDEESVDRLEELLSRSISGQMMADVPLGVFLSGGVDSSLVTALMQRQSSGRVRSFSIGFGEEEFDESSRARAVASHLGTEHTELRVTAKDAMDLVPSLPLVYDEPFADASQVPTLLLSKLTRQHVTVSLSGDGGDELFGGYNRHVAAARVWPKIEKLPYRLRFALSRGLSIVPTAGWDFLSETAKRFHFRGTPSDMGEKIQKLKSMLHARDDEQAYLATITQWSRPEDLLGHEVVRLALAPSGFSSLAEKMMLWDLRGYLPDGILVKVDRAAMAHNLETRVPLLDHRIVEFAVCTPLSRKIKNGQSKWLLRQVLYRHVPRKLIERPKQGFTLPLGQWLRGPLREWAEDLLSPASLHDGGWLNAAPVSKLWREHLVGWRNHQQRLWNVLMFQSWLKEQAVS